MSIPYRNMTQAARAIGIEYCRGVRPTGGYCGDPQTSASKHWSGFVSEDGVVHFAHRRVNRGNLRLLCILAAKAKLSKELEGMEPWQAKWMTCVEASRIASEALHVRIPSSAWNIDRWTVRVQLVDLLPDTPGRAEALRWVNMSPASSFISEEATAA